MQRFHKAVSRYERAELEQAALRPLFVAAFIAYLYLVDRYGAASVFLTIDHRLVWAAFLFGFIVLLSFLYHPGRSEIRRISGILADIAAVSYVFSVTGEAAVAWVGVFIWIIVGNGGRFGNKYLWFSTLAAGVGFVVAASKNEFLTEHQNLGFGILLTIIGISIFA
ncbi:MAG: hypothetical protein U9Q81_05515, partial [Pseudomonadota bacterium]|nr:hypothetical protein [Pseudomonadota bacterium]